MGGEVTAVQTQAQAYTLQVVAHVAQESEANTQQGQHRHVLLVTILQGKIINNSNSNNNLYFCSSLNKKQQQQQHTGLKLLEEEIRIIQDSTAFPSTVEIWIRNSQK